MVPRKILWAGRHPEHHIGHQSDADHLPGRHYQWTHGICGQLRGCLWGNVACHLHWVNLQQLSPLGLECSTNCRYLASPNYPDDYRPNKECTWKITVPDQYQVALKFLSFDLEHHVECSYDFLSIQSGTENNASHVATLCGQTVPDNIVSWSNQMVMKFFSDK